MEIRARVGPASGGPLPRRRVPGHPRLHDHVMKLLKRTAGESAKPAPYLLARRPPAHCAGCKRASARYVYLQNGKDYCLACARAVGASLGIRPAGRRHDDITDLESA